MNTVSKVAMILITLTLIVGCGESNPMGVTTDQTSSNSNGSSVVISSGIVLSSSSNGIIDPNDTGISSQISSSSVNGQSMSSSTPPGYLPGYIPADGNNSHPLFSIDPEFLDSYLNKPFSLENCAYIDTALPHGIPSPYLNFIDQIKNSGNAPTNYDSLLTTISVLRCRVVSDEAGLVFFEITHPGNSDTGFIQPWVAINYSIGGNDFRSDNLTPEMMKVLMQHASPNIEDIGKNGVIFLADINTINLYK